LGACRATAPVAAVVLGATLATGCGSSSPALDPAPTPTPIPPAPVVLDSVNFDTLVVASERTCLVEFQLPTCPYCQAMAPIVERLARDYAGRALVGTVDVSAESALAGAWKVGRVPTFVFFKQGREVSRQVGTASYQDLAARLDALLAGP
jgi:thioredoxin-like negative regulator of GroEL